MDPTPRQVAVLSALAIVPFGVYAALSGELTLVATGVGLVSLALIVGSLVLLFSPDSQSATATHQ